MFRSPIPHALFVLQTQTCARSTRSLIVKHAASISWLLAFLVLGVALPTNAQNPSLRITGNGAYAELDDYVPNSGSNGRNFTVELWVKPNSTDDGQAFIGKHSSTGGSLFLIGYYNGGLHARLGDVTIETGPQHKMTDWQHIAVAVGYTRSDVNAPGFGLGTLGIVLYQNGELVARQSLTNGQIPDLAGRPWVLGMDWAGDEQTDFFDGWIDNVAIWEGALTPDQIAGRRFYVNALEASNQASEERNPLARHWLLDDTMTSSVGTSTEGRRLGGARFAPGPHLVLNVDRFASLQVEIVSAFNKCIDIEGAALGNGVVQQWDCVEVPQQRFTMIPYGGGVELRATHTDDHCVTVEGGNDEGLTTVIQQDCFGVQAYNYPLKKTQHWRFEEIDDNPGWFFLKALHDDTRCLSTPSGQVDANGVDLEYVACREDQLGQLWRIQPVNGPFQLIAAHSLKCLEVDGSSQNNGANIQQSDCLGASQSNQLFDIQFFTNSADGLYEVRALHSNKCMDVSEVSQANQATIYQWDCVEGTNQLWSLKPYLNTFQLAARHSGKCLDVYSFAQQNGADVAQWSCQDLSTNQFWYLLPQSAATSVAAEAPVGVPADYALAQNYPNPFNPATTITYTLAEAGPVRLVVYDVLGRQVDVVGEGMASAGTHTVSFSASGLPSGVYFYTLETESYRETRQMLLVK